MAVAVLGCSSSTSPTSQLLTLSSNGNELTLENQNAWPVYYVALNANRLALYDGALCDDPTSACPRVPGHSHVSIPYATIWSYEAGQKITVQVMQWGLARQPNGTYKPTDVQSQQTTLQ